MILTLVFSWDFLPSWKQLRNQTVIYQLQLYLLLFIYKARRGARQEGIKESRRGGKREDLLFHLVYVFEAGSQLSPAVTATLSAFNHAGAGAGRIVGHPRLADSEIWPQLVLDTVQ